MVSDTVGSMVSEKSRKRQITDSILRRHTTDEERNKEKSSATKRRSVQQREEHRNKEAFERHAM